MTFIELLGFVCGIISTLIFVIIAFYLDFNILEKILVIAMGFLLGWAVGVIIADRIVTKDSDTDNDQQEGKQKQ